MDIQTKSRYVEYISTLRNTLLRKKGVVYVDLQYTENPFEEEYYRNYIKFLDKEIEILGQKLKNLYAL